MSDTDTRDETLERLLEEVRENERAIVSLAVKAFEPDFSERVALLVNNPAENNLRAYVAAIAAERDKALNLVSWADYITELVWVDEECRVTFSARDFSGGHIVTGDSPLDCLRQMRATEVENESARAALAKEEG